MSAAQKSGQVIFEFTEPWYPKAKDPARGVMSGEGVSLGKTLGAFFFVWQTTVLDLSSRRLAGAARTECGALPTRTSATEPVREVAPGLATVGGMKSWFVEPALRDF